MLNVFLCDDDPQHIHHCSSLITQCCTKHAREVEINCFSSGESLLLHFEENPLKADIIFLDVVMDKLTGMETARELRKQGCQASLIFMTAFEDYMNEAFDVQATHYLVKGDFSFEKFERVFMDATRFAQHNKSEIFICEFRGSKTPILLKEIIYFETWKRIITVHYGKNLSAKYYGNFRQLEEEFCEKNFARIHRSYIVSLPYVSQFHTNALLLKNGERIPIGTTYQKAAHKAFSGYLSSLVPD